MFHQVWVCLIGPAVKRWIPKVASRALRGQITEGQRSTASLRVKTINTPPSRHQIPPMTHLKTMMQSRTLEQIGKLSAFNAFSVNFLPFFFLCVADARSASAALIRFYPTGWKINPLHNQTAAGQHPAALCCGTPTSQSRDLSLDLDQCVQICDI